MTFAPAWACDVELTEPIRDLIAPRSSQEVTPRYLRARIIVRLHGAPVGIIERPLVCGCINAARLQRAIHNELGDQVLQHLAADKLASADLHPSKGGTFPFQSGPRADPAEDAPQCGSWGPLPALRPMASVVVCTRDRPDVLRGCLERLQRLAYPAFEVLVVDNAPTTSATEHLVRGFDDDRFRYLVESRPGLSRARNRGLAASIGDVVAFTDDDVRVDEWWLEGLVRGFGRAATVVCTTGLIVAAELETPEQALFEEIVGWGSKLEARLYDIGPNRPQDPLFPFTTGTIGAGASFCARRETFAEVGCFDESLGVGTPSRGGEDLDFFLRVLLSGSSIAYEPTSLAWHVHRRDRASLERQMFGYGSGLAAYAMKQLLSSRTGPSVLARAPLAVTRVFGGKFAVRSGRRASIPRRLRLAYAHGLVAGGVASVQGLRTRRSGPASAVKATPASEVEG